MEDRNSSTIPALVAALGLTLFAYVAPAQEAQDKPSVDAPAVSEPRPETAASARAPTAIEPTAPAVTPALEEPAGATPNTSKADASPPAESDIVKLAPVTVKDVQKLDFDGRRKVVIDGKDYYCKKERVTGSRLNTKTSCLTEQQLVDMNQEARRNIDHMNTKPMDGGQNANLSTGGGSRGTYGGYR